MVLLRRLIGDVLRRHRLRQSLTLREVSAAARVSLGYLSEVERGRKEPSSEMLAAICAALSVPLSEVFREVSDELAGLERPVLAPVGFRPAAPPPSSKVSVARSGAVAGVALRPGAALGEPAPAGGRPSVRPPTPVASLSVRPIAAA